MKILQLPEGLKRRALEIADNLEDVVIECEPCYGACDICTEHAKALGCDAIVHYGHSKFMDVEIPVQYKEMRREYDPVPVLEKNLQNIKFERIGLVSAVQYLDSLDWAKSFLEGKGKKVLVGRGNLKDGQILGCDVSSAKSVENEVDAFLYIGSGKFHPLGLALQTQKPVMILDIENQEIYELDKSKFEKQRYAAIALAKDAKRIGILVSTKPGQLNFDLAKRMKEKLEKQEKKTYILIFNEITPEKLEGLDLDCYICTACPRVAIENRGNFRKPILNPDELESFI